MPLAAWQLVVERVRLSGWQPAHYLGHNLNDLPHDIAAVATDGDLERCGYGCRLVHSNSILLSRGPQGFGLSLQDMAKFTTRRVTGFVMRHEDVAAFAFVAIWSIITLGAVLFLGG